MFITIAGLFRHKYAKATIMASLASVVFHSAAYA
jgi:hypothetical protein